MPKPQENFLTTIIRTKPNGVSVGELMADSRLQYTRRTLQRRLHELLESGAISSKGAGRGRRYYAQPQNSAIFAPYASPASKTSEISAPAEPAPYANNPLIAPLDFGMVCEPQAPTQTENTANTRLSTESQELKRLVTRPLGDRTPVGYQSDFLMSYQPNETFYLPEETRTKLAQMGKISISELPAGTYLRQILDRLLIDLSWNSSRLEGNTYSLLETARLLKMGETVNGKATQETQMILNHKAAIEMLADQADEIGFNRYTLCNLHALLSDNLLPDPASCGRLRDRPVGIGSCVFHPLEVPQLIEEYFQLILIKATQIRDPFEASFFSMVHLPYLQAFEDVNKRTSRLVANIPLIKQNLCPLSFIDVDVQDYLGGLIAVYELNRFEYLRDVFVWAYQRSCQQYNAVKQSLGEPDPFRMTYRQQIGDCVRNIVEKNLHGETARQAISSHAETHIAPSEQQRFLEVISVELNALHEGNIARYRLRPKVFECWSSTKK
jgi:Fic family protein